MSLIRSHSVCVKKTWAMDLSPNLWPTLNESVQNRTVRFQSPEIILQDDTHRQAVPNTSKKKKKSGENITVGVLDVMKRKVSKQRKRVKFITHKNTRPLRRSGNQLDSDQPVRHNRGKQRPDRPKRATVMKRRVVCSRKSTVKFHYSAELLDLKSKLFQLIKANDATTDSLSQHFDRISLKPSDSVQTVNSNVSALIHSKKFRTYCTNLITPDLKKTASNLVVTLRTFQDRLFAQNTVKARAKRRYVCGIRESKKLLLADDVKCLLIGSNLEMEEGLPSFEPLKEILEAAGEKNIPIVYCSKGEDIGYWTLKKRKISVLAILNYEGADDQYNAMILSWKRASSQYEDIKRQVASKLAVAPDRNKTDVTDVEKEIRECIISKLES